MRLISLQINNYRVIKSVRMILPDKVIGIIGPNGAGKSSIIEAVSWALYGNQAARTGKDEIKSNFAGADENCEVALEFSVNEERYRVVRRLVGRTERAEVELYRGETPESVGVNETKAYVGQLLGLDWRGFLSSFLARQAELNALSDLQPSKRRDHIAGMLGIERLDKAIQRVKEDSRLHKEKGQFLESQIAFQDTVADRMAELQADIAELAGPIEKLKQEMDDKQAELKKAKQVLETTQKKRDQWNRLQSKVEAERQNLENLTEQLENLRGEQKQLKQAQQELKKITEQLNELAPVRDEYEKLKEARSRVAVREELLERRKSLVQRKEQAEEKLRLLERRLSECETKLAEIPEDIDKQFTAGHQKLEQARDEYSRLRAEVDALEKQALKLEEQLKSIGQLGPDSVCDRCRRPFGEDYEQIKSHLHDELSQLRRAIKEAEQRVKTQKQAGEKLRGAVAELERLKNARYQLSLDHQSTKREIQSTQKQVKSEIGLLENLDKQLSTYRGLEFDPAAFEAGEKKVKQLDRLRDQQGQLTGSLGRLPEVEKQIISFDTKTRTSSELLESLEKETNALGFEEADYNKCISLYESAQQMAETAASAYLTRSKEKELAEKELEGKLEQMKGFKKTEQELEKSRSAHYYGEKLGRLFTDFRQELIATIRPSLAEISSRLLAEMTDGRYSLVELDDKYNLRVMDSGVYYGVDRFSGGEKDLANLCLRLAISLALTESAGLTRSFVILDEVFGSQDNQRKELILKAMAQLKHRFPQIFLITHVDDVKDGVEQIVEVVPTGYGWSEVRLDGANL